MTNDFYNHDDGYPAFGASGTSAAMRAQFDKIMAGFDKMPDMTGNGSKLLRVNAAASALEAFSAFSDTTDYNVSTLAHGLAPKLPGTTTTFLRGDGNYAAPPTASLIPSSRTSNTIFGSNDTATMVTYTSGTFSQTFTAAATLGSGWFLYVRNSGTGTITLDPDGAELIDGVATLALNPKEARLVVCTGTGFITVPLANVTGYVLLAPPFTPTASANVDFLDIFTSVYDDYLIVANGLCPAADDNLLLQFAVAGAADTGNNYYGGSVGTGTDSTASNSLQAAGNVYNAGRGLAMEIRVQNVNDTTTLKTMQSVNVSQSNSTPTYADNPQWGAYNAANAITGFRLYWSAASNFKAQGTIRVYGLSKQGS